MLQKLTYLSDVESQRRYGRSITGLQYIAYDHGPWLRELYDALAVANDIQERRYLWGGGLGYEYVANAGSPDFSELPEEDREVLDAVIAKWGRKPLNDVLAHVYQSAPYAGTQFGDTVPLERAQPR